MTKIIYSIVAPIYNEIEIIDEFCKRITDVMYATGETWELVLVDDGSTDGSTERIRELASASEQIRGVIFARNFGHQIAVTAGLDFSRGDAVTIIDADLQDLRNLLLLSSTASSFVLRMSKSPSIPATSACLTAKLWM